MGKGDKKSKKGKIVKGTYGNSRPRQATKRKANEKEQAAAK
ncbi:30S ribosomal protein THX [Pontibacter sp. HSC-14F20]|nr:30S ribosomal protein THX [Pontibacter sp. HSC-14F20]MBX0334079.1 30S ribosomal protein THX [Pontibacter sp. HSC-14F20]